MAKQIDIKVPVAKPLVKVRSFAGCFIVHTVPGKLDQTLGFCVLFADAFADHASLILFANGGGERFVTQTSQDFA